LCFKYFAPPGLELGYEECAFIRTFKDVSGVTPLEAWAAHQGSANHSD